MFPKAIKRNGFACRGCGWIVDERDVCFNDDLPPLAFCPDCFEDYKINKEDKDA